MNESQNSLQFRNIRNYLENIKKNARFRFRAPPRTHYLLACLCCALVTIYNFRQIKLIRFYFNLLSQQQTLHSEKLSPCRVPPGTQKTQNTY